MNTTFIILNWNTAQITKKCVLSIYKHLDKKDFQIVIVDNASTDNSISLFKKLQKKHKNLFIIKNQSNLGFSAGNNTAQKYFITKYLVFLNSDILLFDNSITNAINYLKKHKNIGLVAPKLILADGTTQNSIYPPQTIINAIKQYWFGKKTFSPYFSTSKKPTTVWAVAGAAIIIKSCLFKKIGMWNEKYFIYFEDLDLCRSLRKINKKIIYFPKAKLIHLHGSSGQSIANQSNQWKRLIPSSIKYHGILKHYLLFLIVWIGQKLKK